MPVTEALYIILISLELLLLGIAATYAVLFVYSWLQGAPYVPTQNKEVQTILKEANIQKSMTFLELGCGDGRVTREAVKQYQVKGIGIDINPELVIRARILAKRDNLSGIEFHRKNITDTDVSKADVIYIFLFPALIERIKEKLLHQTKQEALIISHGFKIPFLSSMLVKELKGTKFTTYYYQKVQSLIDKSL
ncbi:MAG TPA: class I SAM-dependent methyltransferase [Candidatus Woesebacteria bacterium]|nr:class I SAM-dependent methyltransferase [Candidatus Woesebacteria bacterium]